MSKNAIELRHGLLEARKDRFPIIFVCPGSGQVARYAVEGGAHFSMILNAGLFRSAGVSSLGCYLPYGNANDQTEYLIRNQIIPRVRDVPLVAGMMPNDPVTPIETRFKRMAKLGIAGIINWPAVGITDGSFRQAMHMDGLTVEAEIEMLKQARGRGFVTFGFAFAPGEAAMMTKAEIEVLVFNMGWTRESKDIYEKADRVELAVVKINEMLRAVRDTGKNPVCLFYGGAAILPEDSAVIYQRCWIQGHGGGSSYERIPVAKLIADNVRKFRSVPRRAKSNSQASGLGKLVGNSPPMTQLYKLIKRVAPFDVSVCIEGESGVGKELVATQIHNLSNRSSQYFITLNCGAIPDTLLESEFFGHEKGAFTGAVSRRLGKFELADQGTLLLDEVAELSPKAQVSLLRVLQQKEISRVGGEKAIAVNPRIITATHQDLKALVEQGRFRADLYFRLNLITLKVPPLRRRTHDLPVLVNVFLDELGPQFDREVIGISQGFMSRLRKHSWPGNVRELKHVLSRAILMEDGPILHGDDFYPGVGVSAGMGNGRGVDIGNSEVEANLLANALKAARGNKSKAAMVLGISRKTLYTRLKKANLFVPRQ
jgi:DNA-binding NtrC family response regulator/predicted TIM-barrel enzyme